MYSLGIRMRDNTVRVGFYVSASIFPLVMDCPERMGTGLY